MRSRWKEISDRLVNDELFGRVFSGSLWAYASQLLAAVLGLVVYVTVSQLYGPWEIGAMAITQSFVLVVATVSSLGTASSALKLLPQHIAQHSMLSARAVYRRSVWLVLTAALPLAALIVVAEDHISTWFFDSPDYASFFRVGSIALILTALTWLNTSAMRSLGLIRSFATFSFMPQALNILFLLAATRFSLSSSLPVYCFLAANICTGLMSWALVEYEFNKRIQPDETITVVKRSELLSLSSPMLMSTLFMTLIAQSGVVAIGLFRSETDAGYYAVAIKLSALTGMFLTAVNAVAAPKFSELYHQSKPAELILVARKSAKLIFIVTAPAFAFLIFLGPLVLELFFGTDFRVSYWPLVILVAGQAIRAACGSTRIFMDMTGLHRDFRNIIVATGVVSVLLQIALVQAGGITGAALATAVSIAIWSVAAAMSIKKHFGHYIGYLPGLSRNEPASVE